MRKIILLGAAIVATLGTSALHAQGSLSMQGFGYPPGELSTRALGTAGALGEVDSRSPINPASMAIKPVAQIFAQYDPEFRTVTAGGQTASTTTARVPNIGGTLPITSHLVLGISASTFLDRTWQTSINREQPLGPNPGDTVSWVETLKSEGAITDVRFAAAYSVGSRLRFGVGFHTFPGSLRLTSNDIFADTTRYRSITQLNSVSFSGSAWSAGIEADLLPSLHVAVSGRTGGTAKMFVDDSLFTTATIPTRYSGSVSFTGIPGTTVAVRGARERWSQLNGLNYAPALAVDADDISFGVESNGPRIGSFPLLLRVGARRRTLPFAVGTSSVDETSWGGGIGVPIAFDRVTFDIAALRVTRTGVTGVDEHATNLSFGLQVRP